MNPYRLLILIPAFNEEASIANVIASVRKYAPGADIVVINDGSTDRTRAIAQGLGVVVLNHVYNLGIGATMQTGYKYAVAGGYDIAVQLDGDGQPPAEQINDIISLLRGGEAALVCGLRHLALRNVGPSIARGAGMA